MIITSVWNDTAASNVGALSGNFTTNGGYVQIFFTGSAWSGAGAAMVGANLVIDGNVVTSARVFTNEQASHKSLVPVSLVIRLPVGPHTVAIALATPPTRIDQNDLFTLTVTELSFS